MTLTLTMTMTLTLTPTPTLTLTLTLALTPTLTLTLAQALTQILALTLTLTLTRSTSCLSLHGGAPAPTTFTRSSSGYTGSCEARASCRPVSLLRSARCRARSLTRQAAARIAGRTTWWTCCRRRSSCRSPPKASRLTHERWATAWATSCAGRGSRPCRRVAGGGRRRSYRCPLLALRRPSSALRGSRLTRHFQMFLSEVFFSR